MIGDRPAGCATRWAFQTFSKSVFFSGITLDEQVFHNAPHHSKPRRREYLAVGLPLNSARETMSEAAIHQVFEGHAADLPEVALLGVHIQAALAAVVKGQSY